MILFVFQRHREQSAGHSDSSWCGQPRHHRPPAPLGTHVCLLGAHPAVRRHDDLHLLRHTVWGIRIRLYLFVTDLLVQCMRDSYLFPYTISLILLTIYTLPQPSLKTLNFAATGNQRSKQLLSCATIVLSNGCGQSNSQKPLPRIGDMHRQLFEMRFIIG